MAIMITTVTITIATKHGSRGPLQLKSEPVASDTGGGLARGSAFIILSSPGEESRIGMTAPLNLSLLQSRHGSQRNGGSVGDQ